MSARPILAGRLFGEEGIGEGLDMRRGLFVERVVDVVELTVKAFDGGRVVVTLDRTADGVVRGFVEGAGKADELLDLLVVCFFRQQPTGHHRLQRKWFRGLSFGR